MHFEFLTYFKLSQPLNISCLDIKFSKSKLYKSIEVKDKQPETKKATVFKLSDLNDERSKLVKYLLYKNIPNILSTLLVLKFLTSILVKLQ